MIDAFERDAGHRIERVRRAGDHVPPRDGGQKAIGLDPRPSPATHVIDDLSDRARLRDLIAREKITHIIHAGGVSGPMVMADDPAGVIAINVTGSMNLLYEAMAGGVTTFVYCSSVAAIGNYYEPEPIGEDYPMRPASTYGCSKAAMDYVLRGLWNKVPLDICSLRLTAVYGPGRRDRIQCRHHRARRARRKAARGSIR